MDAEAAGKLPSKTAEEQACEALHKVSAAISRVPKPVYPTTVTRMPFIGNLRQGEAKVEKLEDDVSETTDKQAVASREDQMDHYDRLNAAIRLGVPQSGTPWVDVMIRESMRWDAAVAAMQGMLAANSYSSEEATVRSFRVADAIIAEAGKGTDEKPAHVCMPREHGEGGPATVYCDECKGADDGKT